MSNVNKIGIGTGIGILLLVIGVFAFRNMQAEARLRDQMTETQNLCNKWSDQLDMQTTDSGVYIQMLGIPEKDLWGNRLTISYFRGGGMETLIVRSFGPDGKEYSSDDVVSTRHSVNLAGIGSGIKDNIEETAEKGSRGMVRGAIDALKEKRDKP